MYAHEEFGGFMETIKFGLKYWKKELLPALGIQILSFLAIIADLLIPLLSALLINHIIKGTVASEEGEGFFDFLLNGKYGEIQTFELFRNIAILFLGLILIRIILIYIKNTMLQHLGLKFETDLRLDTFSKLMELDSQTVASYNSGELLQIVNGDTVMFKEMFCRMIPNIMDSLFVLIVTVFLLSTINIRFILIPIILMPFLIITLINFRKKAKENFRKIRQSDSDMNLTVQENIAAVRLVRSFTNEELEKEKFNTTNNQLKNSHINQILLSSKFEVIFGVIRQIAYVGTIVIGAVLVMEGHMLIGYIATCTAYVTKIMDHITQINNTLFQMQQQLVAGLKMKLFMERESNILDVTESTLTSEQPHIQLENASLVIEDMQVLKNISIDIPYGKKLGIAGGTGSGKSVLLKSLVRIHDLTGGEMTIDNNDIKDFSLKNLREMYAYVFQDVFLFSNTIDSNIAYSEPNVDEKMVVQSAMNAQAHNFISQLSDGYGTIVGERGLGISGGQKQRVSIARALLKDAPVLILDDSTSALDVNTEKQLLENINTNYPEKTMIITAHRLSSVVDCDEIIYMQDGEIKERGTFEQLMKLNGSFAEVYNIQQTQRQSMADFETLSDGSEV